jgi:hypothetical protein
MIITGMLKLYYHRNAWPTCIFWANLTPFSPKYEWAVKEFGGFGIWATGMVCPFGIYEQMQADYAAVGSSCEQELAAMWGAIPSPYA